MTLATTCPECRTSFKVVPDQLKLHRGLVRCGRCQRVFSGIDFLTYLEADDSASIIRAPNDSAARDSRLTDSTPELPGGLAHRPDFPEDAGPNTIVAAAVFRSARVAVDRRSTSDESTPSSSSSATEPAAMQSRLVPENVASRAEADSEIERITLASYTDDPLSASPLEQRTLEREPVHRVTPKQPAVDPFSAERASVDQTPVDEPQVAAEPEAGEAFVEEPPSAGARFPWAAATVCGLLLVALLAQAAIGWRNDITARVPALAPWFKQAGFATQAPRDRSALSIESFELRTLDIPGRMELLAVLRNRASHPVAEPAMELRLTDGSGAVVVRKVLRPGDPENTSGSAAGTLPARSEKPIRMMLELNGPSPSGYSVDLFYP